MPGNALIIGIIGTLRRLTVDTDGFAGMQHGALESILSFSSLHKAFTAGIVGTAGMLAANHYISLAAKVLLIVNTIFNCTL